MATITTMTIRDHITDSRIPRFVKPRPFRPALPNRPRPLKQVYPWNSREKRMTIAVGFCVSDGVLMCADTEYSGTGVKRVRHDLKIYVGGHRAASRDRGAGFGASPRDRRTRNKREPRLDRPWMFQIRRRPVVTGFGSGSPARIRTSIHGSKGRCPTIRRPGNG